MNLLMSYTAIPHTTGVFLEKALRRLASVVTYGPTAGEDIFRAWNLLSLLPYRKSHDIFLGDGSDRELRDGLPEFWRPDAFLFVESGILYRCEFLKSLDCPKACYLIDTHLHPESHLVMAREFDLVFLAQKTFVPRFQEELDRPVIWLPLACDPELHCPYPVAEEVDVTFAGSIQSPLQERTRRLKRLSTRFSVRTERVFLDSMPRFLSTGRLLFNASVKNDLNMRVFESLAIGKCLLTDDVPGLRDLFVPGEDLAIYDDRSLVDVARTLLDHPEIRTRMAASGRKKVLESHTYLHRARTILSTLESSLKRGSFVPEGADHDEHTHV
ncbi:CgeB family protein [Leptospirillum ferriphilum]|jgi:glycosyltransferase involved in cell wall biosynthesis|uniref:Spore protein YkvP/CgeB glycosyl transferase-like domain-containing protein n=2 Tax=Leptospirillum ferriphilum TaxID=178606 RepID=A0A1V3SUN7_9BACT|nr:glycosyltransferase [Leptospirillum ferriphilum]AFS54483.1 hypothetical protein LFML04_2293 [Leptospirillum ferriphilum ML-04]OOH71450.1 hypothetical protein BOX24_07970 [Leptospirillum ferriphilum]